jgi:hypothetical protein
MGNKRRQEATGLTEEQRSISAVEREHALLNIKLGEVIKKISPEVVAKE